MLVDGTAYQVLLCYKKKYCLFTFETAQEALDFYDFVNHGKICIKEQRNSLYEKIKVNVDVIFNPTKFIYFNDLVTQILIRQNKDPIDQLSIFKNIDLINVNSTAYKILTGFFISASKKYENLCTVADFISKLYVESIRKKIKFAEEKLGYVIHTSLSSLLHYKNMMDKLLLKDPRFDLMFSYLLNMYKRLFFNTTSKIMINMIGNLKNPAYQRDAEGKHTYVIYMDFFKELKNFVNEFEPFAEYKGFSSIVAEFIRKQVYVFISHLTFICSNNAYGLSNETYYLLLDGVFYLIRETDKLLTYLQIKFGHRCIIPKYLLNFKKTFLNLGEVLYTYLSNEMDKELDRLGELDLDNFDFDIFLKTKLRGTYETLQALHNYYSIKFLRHLIFKLVSKVICAVKLKNREWIEDNLKERVADYNEYFIIMMKSQNFDNFAKFFDYFRKFIFTKSVDNAETLLSMMINILGERLDPETVNCMIRSRLDDTFGFQGLKLRNFYTYILEHQRKGELNIMNKQNHKRRVSHLLSVFLVSCKFLGKHRLSIKKHRSMIGANMANAPTAISGFSNLDYRVDYKGASHFKMLFVRNPEYHTWDDQAILADLKATFVKAAIFKYSFYFSRDTVYLLDERSKVVKSYFLAKFDELQMISINNKPCLMVGYGPCDKLVIASAKQQKIDAIHKTFSDVLGKTKELKFNTHM